MFCPVCGESIGKGSLDEHLLSTHTEEEVREIMNVPHEPVARMTRGEHFQKLYATNFEIMETEHDVRIDVLNERRTHPATPVHPQIIEFISESQVIMRPVVAKKLFTVLRQFIIAYEDQHGEL